MRVWLACFFVLFALAELFDWVKEFSLPLPIYILGGAFLAVASNYDKIVGSYLSDRTIERSPQPTPLEPSAQTINPMSLNMSHPVEDEQPSQL
ncbi:hypothetical protein H6G41_21650 [Tolypothrix sp. FACHB-123]|uniref:hypothetical protein n=1 Tax=Tolypothrix sp. FACHB-123 TaxID=2692868 RepID=UPI0016852924|nr:hypothetical protein [Tolypothrix sp. FACHB-123]MBD2357196.1 hypothetical protein [Tolypothrix sp. FACHB-123]